MKLLEKKELRRIYINKRESLSQEEREALSKRIVDRILELKEIKGAKKVLLFCPIRGEPDITPLFSWVLKEGKRLVLPKVEGENLKLIEVEKEKELSIGAFCIPEPKEGKEVSPQEIEFSLIPGLIFDKEGYRIGYGKGYYDKLLDRLKGKRVGVCYDFQVVERLPRDSWDKPVDWVLTEKKLYKGGKET
ncbi:MAG: 5-formyltetrahydrofolate cyclo-ligase [Aquificaceae bacterium]